MNVPCYLSDNSLFGAPFKSMNLCENRLNLERKQSSCELDSCLNLRFSLYFSLLAGNRNGERFAADSMHRHRLHHELERNSRRLSDSAHHQPLDVVLLRDRNKLL